MAMVLVKRTPPVPNVFVKEACMGNKAYAAKAWVTPNDRLRGFSPAEVWDHPELLLSEEDRAVNPPAGPLTLVAMRTRIVRTVKSDDVGDMRLTPASVPAPDMRDLLTETPVPAPFPLSGVAPINGNGHGSYAAVSKLVEDIRRRKRSRRY